MSKKLWFASVPSILFLTTMFVSSTFAWFTDFAVNSGNRVQSGDLAVGFSASDALENGNLGGTVQDLKVDTDPVFNLGNAAQPGDSQERYLRIRNEGNIAINYQVDFAVTVDSRLAEVIDFEIQPLGGSTTTVVGTNIDQGIYITLQDNVRGEGGLLRVSPDVPQEYEIWRVKMIYTSRADNTYNDASLVFEVDIRLNAWQFNYSEGQVDGSNGSSQVDPYAAYRDIYANYLIENPEYEGDIQQFITDLISGNLAQKEVFTVSFNSNGGSAVASQQVVDGMKATLPTEPTRLDYTFVGWFINGLEQWVFGAYNVTENMTLIARWRSNAEETFDIFYVLGYENLVQIQTVSYGENITALNPSRTGYTFGGWELADRTTAYTGGIFDQRENLVVYATWTARTFMLTLDPKEGVLSQSELSKQVIFGQPFTLPKPTTELENFTGWFNGNDKLTDKNGNSLSTWSLLSDVTLTALYFIEVNSLEDFNAIRSDLSASYLLNTDLTLSGEWTPIGSINTPFFGQLDGNGHTISNLTVTATQSYVGLFGVASGTIRNLKVANVTIDVNGPIDGPVYAGAVVGFSRGATLQNIETLSGTVAARSRAANAGYVGGMVGLIDITSTNKTYLSLTNRIHVTGNANGYGGIVGGSKGRLTLNDSINYGNVTGTSYVGGLVGRSGVEDIGSSFRLTSSRTKNYGNITGISNVGGNIGRASTYSNQIDFAENFGEVLGAGTQVGGIAGYVSNYSSLRNSINDAKITNLYTDVTIDLNTYIISRQSNDSGQTSYTGGIVGYVSYDVFLDSNVNSGDVVGMSSVGGIVGYSESSNRHTNLKNNGKIIGLRYVGGIVGSSSSSLPNFSNSNLLNLGEINGFNHIHGSGSMPAHDSIGGIYGEAGGIKLSNALNYGDIKVYGRINQIGGLIGYSSSGSIINSGNYADVSYLNANSSNGSSIGGLIGYGSTVNLGYVFNSGRISGQTQVGGLIGQANNSLFAYYAINFGEVMSKTSSIGGIVGSTLPTSNDLEQVYYTNTNLVGEEAVDGIAFGTKLTNLSLINEEFFTAMMEWSTDTWSFEGLDIENGVYPVLVFTLPPEEVIA
jgi:uncharacterized repeat protein (TIGR02543 family)